MDPTIKRHNEKITGYKAVKTDDDGRYYTDGMGGHGNSGDGNSGDGYRNYFCTDTRYFLFDVECTKEEVWQAQRIDMSWFDLTDKTYKEAWALCPQHIVEQIKQLPNFNAEKFFEITGIKLECDCWKYEGLKLFIIPGSREMCKRVQQRLFEMGHKWRSRGQDIQYLDATSIIVNHDSQSLMYGDRSLAESIQWRTEHFPDSELLTGQEFLDKYGEGK